MTTSFWSDSQRTRDGACVANALKSAGVQGDLAKSLTALASTAVGAAAGSVHAYTGIHPIVIGESMDVSELLTSSPSLGAEVSVTGWILDTRDGLFLLGAHEPRDRFFPIRIKINNANVMHAISEVVPLLGGGYSKLFYRAKTKSVLATLNPPSMDLECLSIEVVRNSGHYFEVDVSKDAVRNLKNKYGDYIFHPINPFEDWLDIDTQNP